ncbi:MAG: sulfatase-like hydrolase/transferase [Pyrinomonadaceae bacterium]
MTDKNNRNFSRREFIGGAIAASAVTTGILNSSAVAASRPNILFILADDAGWGDLSCYGRPDYRTPNLDKLARQGIRFTNAYSAAPVCTPTRVGFHTGRYPARLSVGLEEPIHERKELSDDKLKATGIPHEHPTVSSLIKSAGYSTALIGKWHVGYLPYFGPLKCGYDEFYGNMSGAVDHFTHKDMSASLDFFEDEVPVEKIGYMTDLLTERAVEYVRRSHKKPFYLSLHYTAPHWPWEGPRDRAVSDAMKYGPVGFRAGGSIKVYAEMMENMDAGIGRVLDALKTSGLDRNTLIIFTSDNGGERFSYNWPFTGQKMDLHEGGVRVPAIVRWPGVTTAGVVSDQPVITMDWTATMIAAAGGKQDVNFPLDGDDIKPVLNGTKRIYDRTLFWRTYRQGAMRRGKWKYIREGKSEFLHDLSVDEREQADFKNDNPDILERLRTEFLKWESGMQHYPSGS